jgi:cellulase
MLLQTELKLNIEYSPVQVFLAENKGNLKGPVFTKVASESFTGGQWATDKLIRNKGKHSFTFPHVPAGEYIIRPEIVALHEGNRQGGAQLYMACIQVKVASGSGAVGVPLYRVHRQLC